MNAVPDRIYLDDYAVAILGDEPRFVLRAVEDLRDYIEDWTGKRPELGRPGVDRYPEHGMIVVLTFEPSERSAPGSEAQASLVFIEDEGKAVLATGPDWQGTAYAVMDLAQSIRFDNSRPWIPADLDLYSSPRSLLRGMYAHLHWQYNSPYALRSWSLDQWKRYIDLLAWMKINLFQIWTMAAICPNPLSPEDEAYLKKYRAVVRYAREERGMEVWPGECANNVAESDFGQPIENREYFQAEVLKDPGDPEQFQDIMDSRANMYRLIDDGDGYWIIDSDPGKWPGSPASELADIFAGNRDLIDRHSEKGRDAKLVYWMWQGWGTSTPEENWRGVIEGLKEKVHEPWWLTPCNEAHLGLVREMGLMEKSVFFPYGVIEPEPSNPFTHIKFAELSDRIDVALDHPGLAGIMGNAQTPFAQLPNIWYLACLAWDPDLGLLADHETLRRLGWFIFPDIADDLADGWHAAWNSHSDEAFEVSRRLEKRIEEGKTGKPGVGGRFILPDPKLIVEDLALLLRIHAYAEQVKELVEGKAHDDPVREALLGYMTGVLEWQRRTGFHGCRVDGEDFRGGGTLLYGKDFLVVYQAVRKHFGRPGNARKRRAWAEEMEKQLEETGFSDSMSKRAVFEAILEPGRRRPDGRK